MRNFNTGICKSPSCGVLVAILALATIFAAALPGVCCETEEIHASSQSGEENKAADIIRTPPEVTNEQPKQQQDWQVEQNGQPPDADLQSRSSPELAAHEDQSLLHKHNNVNENDQQSHERIERNPGQPDFGHQVGQQQLAAEQGESIQGPDHTEPTLQPETLDGVAQIQLQEQLEDLTSSISDQIIDEPLLLMDQSGVPIPHCFGVGQQCTLSMWVWLHDISPSVNSVIMHSKTPAGVFLPSLFLGLPPGSDSIFLGTHAQNFAAVEGAFTTGAPKEMDWTHLAITTHEEHVTFYVDGQMSISLQVPTAKAPRISVDVMHQNGVATPQGVQSISSHSQGSSFENFERHWDDETGRCIACRYWPFNSTLALGGSRFFQSAEGVVMNVTLWNTSIPHTNAHKHPALQHRQPPSWDPITLESWQTNANSEMEPEQSDAHMKDSPTMDTAGDQGADTSEDKNLTPAISEEPDVSPLADDEDFEDDVEDSESATADENPDVLLTEPFTGQPLQNLLTRTQGSNRKSSSHTLMALAFRYLLPRQQREDAVMLLPDVNVSAPSENTELVFSDPIDSDHIDYRRACAYLMPVANEAVQSMHDESALRVDFGLLKDFEDSPLEADRVKGEDGHTVQFNRQEAEAGNADAQAWLGTQYYWGANGLPRDRDMARNLLERAAQQGQAEAMYNLGVMNAYGHGIPVNAEAANNYFRQAADAGYAPAQNGLGLSLAQQADAESQKEAFKLFNASAAQNNADGLFNKGILLKQGMGASIDLKVARSCFQAAADLEHPAAAVTFAEMLMNGEGGPTDFSTAAVYLKKAAESGVVGRTLNKAMEHFFAQNYTEAARLYAIAASAGIESAQLNLAHIYESKIEPPMMAHAVKAYQLAAALGNPFALQKLGDILWSGQLGYKNDSHAMQIYKHSCGSGGSAAGCFNAGLIEFILGNNGNESISSVVEWMDQAYELSAEAWLPIFLAKIFVLKVQPGEEMFAWLDSHSAESPTGQYALGLFARLSMVCIAAFALPCCAVLATSLYLGLHHESEQADQLDEVDLSPGSSTSNLHVGDTQENDDIGNSTRDFESPIASNRGQLGNDEDQGLRLRPITDTTGTDDGT